MKPWVEVLRNNFRSWHDLADFLELSEENRAHILKTSNFPLNLPKRLAEKIAKNTLSDPILRQFLPLIEEEISVPNFSNDPIAELGYRKGNKLIHKYVGRALMVASGACAMHCRYCFRRHFPYETDIKGHEQEIEEVRNDPTIEEIILSGGDPLSLSNRSLKNLIEQLSSIPHIQRIRFHTRFPIGIPERIDEEFLEILGSCKRQIFFVIHCNHANELDEDIFKALKAVQMLGIPVLDQSVLLKGVNDSTETLKDLFSKLVERGIIPYYMHQLDRVEGAAHFEVAQDTAIALFNDLQALLPGYAVPRLVQDIPHRSSKTALYRT